MCLLVIMGSLQLMESGNLCFMGFQYMYMFILSLISCQKMKVSGIILILFCVYGLTLTVRHHLNILETVRAVQRIDGLSQHQLAHYLGVSSSFVNRFWACYLRQEITAESQGKATKVNCQAGSLFVD